MLVLLVLVACTLHVNAGYTPFFYTAHPQPIVHQPLPPPQATYYHHQPPPPQPLTYHQTFAPQYYQPIAYTSFVPQIYTPHQPFYHHQYTFSHALPPPVHTEQQQQQPLETNTTDTPTLPPAPLPTSVDNDVTLPPPQQDDSVITNAQVRGLSLTSELDENTIDNYRGFAYRNDYENGRSHVLFITGPEAQKFSQHLRNSNNVPDLQSRTAASDAVDANAASEKLMADSDESIEALIKYVDNPPAGVHQFYSVNNALVMRRLEDDMPHFGTPKTGSLPITQQAAPLLPIFKSALALNIESATGRSEEEGDETEKEDLDADDESHTDETEEEDDSSEKEENETAASQIATATTMTTNGIQADNDATTSSTTAKSDEINIRSEASTATEIKIASTDENSTPASPAAFTSGTITSTASTTTTTTTTETPTSAPSTEEVTSTSETTTAAATTIA